MCSCYVGETKSKPRFHLRPKCSLCPPFPILTCVKTLRSCWGDLRWWTQSLASRISQLPARIVQSCPTLCNPMHCSPPGSSVYGIVQARILDWLPFPSPGDLPDPGIKLISPESPALQTDSLPTEPSRKPVATCSPCFTTLHRHYKWRFVASLCQEEFFPAAFAYFVSHVTLVIPATFQTFSLLFYLLWWPVISDLCYYYCQKIMTCWRLRRWWTCFSNKVFLINVWTCS